LRWGTNEGTNVFPSLSPALHSARPARLAVLRQTVNLDVVVDVDVVFYANRKKKLRRERSLNGSAREISPSPVSVDSLPKLAERRASVRPLAPNEEEEERALTVQSLQFFPDIFRDPRVTLLPRKKR